LAVKGAQGVKLGRPPAVDSKIGDDAHPGAELVKDDQSDRRERQDPEKLIAVLGANDGVRGDASWIVVGEAGKDTGTDYCEQGYQRSASQQLRAPEKQAPVQMATGDIGFGGAGCLLVGAPVLKLGRLVRRTDHQGAS
jgi:hypothetical protein